MSRVVIIGGEPRSLVLFRGDLIRSIVARGHEVVAMASAAGTGQVEAISQMGARFEPIPIRRTGVNPVVDVVNVMGLLKRLRQLRPDVLFAYTAKPVIWSGWVCRFLPRTRFVPMITGLGYTLRGPGPRARLLGALTTVLYRSSLSRADHITFQNADDLKAFHDRRILRGVATSVVAGSGVNCCEFAFAPLPDGAPSFLMIARLLKAKGIREFCDAARRVRQRHPAVQFTLVGPADTSPDRIDLAEIRALHHEGVLAYAGESDDVRPHLRRSHIFVLPSHHEGMPRTVLEALAIGRPVITTLAPGCRDTVVDAESGWRVPVGDVNALVDRIEWMLSNRARWDAMGRAARRRAEAVFDVATVNSHLVNVAGL